MCACVHVASGQDDRERRKLSFAIWFCDTLSNKSLINVGIINALNMKLCTRQPRDIFNASSSLSLSHFLISIMFRKSHHLHKSSRCRIEREPVPRRVIIVHRAPSTVSCSPYSTQRVLQVISKTKRNCTFPLFLDNKTEENQFVIRVGKRNDVERHESIKLLPAFIERETFKGYFLEYFIDGWH